MISPSLFFSNNPFLSIRFIATIALKYRLHLLRAKYFLKCPVSKFLLVLFSEISSHGCFKHSDADKRCSTKIQLVFCKFLTHKRIICASTYYEIPTHLILTWF